MKIYMKSEGRTVCVKDEGEGQDIYELFELIESAVIALGYHPNSFKSAVLAKAEEYELDEENKKEEK